MSPGTGKKGEEVGKFVVGYENFFRDFGEIN